MWCLAFVFWLVLIAGYMQYRIQTPETFEPVSAKFVMKSVVLPSPPPPLPLLAGNGNDLEKKNDLKNEKNGRSWLAKLEQGEGPDIVITWPHERSDREWVLSRLVQCGVRLGKWRNGRLRAVESGNKTMSGFVRVLDGALSMEELSRLQLLPGDGLGVRIFPRNLDIQFLSGLSQVTSGQFLQAKQVRAHYRKQSNRLIVENIRVDGVRFQKDIVLLPEDGSCVL